MSDLKKIATFTTLPVIVPTAQYRRMAARAWIAEIADTGTETGTGRWLSGAVLVKRLTEQGQTLVKHGR